MNREFFYIRETTSQESQIEQYAEIQHDVLTKYFLFPMMLADFMNSSSYIFHDIPEIQINRLSQNRSHGLTINQAN